MQVTDGAGKCKNKKGKDEDDGLQGSVSGMELLKKQHTNDRNRESN